MTSTYGKITLRVPYLGYVTCCIMLCMSYIYVYACVKARDFAGTWDWASEIVPADMGGGIEEVDPLLL